MESALINKFFRKECTPEEAIKVAFYLQSHPEVLEQYMSIEEWSATGKHFMPADFWETSWLAIRKRNKQKNIVVLMKRGIAIAASLVLIASAVYYFYPQQKQIIPPAIAAVNNPAIEYKSITNTTNKILKIVLQDSSVIKLLPASTIKYEVPFTGNKRDISLTGEAYFKVSKDKTRPFTVFAAGLATTALGTSFNIKINKKTNVISVKLFTGKVVIKAIQNFNGWLKDVYLLPGQQMRFDEDDMQLAISKLKTDTAATLIIVSNVKQNKDSLNTALSFNNTMLPQVLNKISVYYNVKIRYDSALIDTINFTGVVLKSDSLPVILKVITQMNNLEVLKKEDEYIISKHEQ